MWNLARQPYLSAMKFVILFLFVALNSDAQDTTVLITSKKDTTAHINALKDTIAVKPYFLVRTTGPMPYLEYGPGDDRLGGAKMTYLDSNLLLQVVDSLATDYKVQLSKNHFAYIPKANTKADSVTAKKPYYLSGSWKVYGDELQDYISVQLDERLPYRSQQTLSPSGLTIDVYGTTSNTNWITQTGTAKEINNVWYEQVEDDLLRIHVQLKHRQHWGHYISYDSSSGKLLIRIKRQPPLKSKNLTIAIDAGHGGANTGASGRITKILEKDYTLKFANELNKRLKRKGYKVFMTRTSDVDISMIDRALMLRRLNPDLLLSLHLNSSANVVIKGTSTYYRYIGFRPLSQTILKRLLALGLANFGNVGAFNFALSGPTEYPNCLVEIAFLSNEEDEKRIADPKFQKKVAKQIQKGVRDWLKNLDN
ncbi:MAG: N-acetylmuramoyl-L-alanine amidase [Chitinophagaceae bacterium]|nr:MAG: N-acetylmuramoyl-L-alanine amidase [Chitinophagaceae bacterium]